MPLTREFGFQNRNFGDFTRAKRPAKPIFYYYSQGCRIIPVYEEGGGLASVVKPKCHAFFFGSAGLFEFVISD
jgi:hypothetical protein